MPTICKELKQEFRGELLGLQRESKKPPKKEMGLVFCRVDDKLEIVNKCEGDKCRIIIRGRCPPNYQEKLMVHTHPSQNPLSASDIGVTIKEGRDKVCAIMPDGVMECAENIKNISTPRRNEYFEIIEDIHGMMLRKKRHRVFREKLKDKFGVAFCKTSLR